MTYIVVIYFRDGTINTHWVSSLVIARSRTNEMLDLPSVQRVVVARILNDIEKDKL